MAAVGRKPQAGPVREPPVVSGAARQMAYFYRVVRGTSTSKGPDRRIGVRQRASRPARMNEHVHGSRIVIAAHQSRHAGIAGQRESAGAVPESRVRAWHRQGLGVQCHVWRCVVSSETSSSCRCRRSGWLPRRVSGRPVDRNVPMSGQCKVPAPRARTQRAGGGGRQARKLRSCAYGSMDDYPRLVRSWMLRNSDRRRQLGDIESIPWSLFVLIAPPRVSSCKLPNRSRACAR